MKESKAVYLFLSSAIVIVLDQLAKLAVRHSIAFNSPVKLLPLFQLNHIRNFGAGFGILQGQRWPLVFIGIFAVGIILYYYGRIPDKKIPSLSVGLLLGGIVSNIIDRAFLGYVTDFIDIAFWPAFNIADAAITAGAILLIAYCWKK